HACWRRWRALPELTGEFTIRVADVRDLRPDALLVREIGIGRASTGGGVFERSFLFLQLFGTDGRLTRLELFDPDREAEALARFDELTAVAAPTPQITNAATHSIDRFRAAWEARDWNRVAAEFAPEL